MDSREFWKVSLIFQWSQTYNMAFVRQLEANSLMTVLYSERGFRSSQFVSLIIRFRTLVNLIYSFCRCVLRKEPLLGRQSVPLWGHWTRRRLYTSWLSGHGLKFKQLIEHRSIVRQVTTSRPPHQRLTTSEARMKRNETTSWRTRGCTLKPLQEHVAAP